MPESIKKKEHTVHTQVGDAIQGDQILIECRKPGKWQTVRGSEQHLQRKFDGVILMEYS